MKLWGGRFETTQTLQSLNAFTEPELELKLLPRQASPSKKPNLSSWSTRPLARRPRSFRNRSASATVTAKVIP